MFFQRPQGRSMTGERVHHPNSFRDGLRSNAPGVRRHSVGFVSRWLLAAFGLALLAGACSQGFNDLRLLIWGEKATGTVTSISELTVEKRSGKKTTYFLNYTFRDQNEKTHGGTDSFDNIPDQPGEPMDVIYLIDNPKVSRSAISSHWRGLVCLLTGLPLTVLGTIIALKKPPMTSSTAQ
jgi:hypothetical protein